MRCEGEDTRVWRALDKRVYIAAVPHASSGYADAQPGGNNNIAERIFSTPFDFVDATVRWPRDTFDGGSMQLQAHIARYSGVGLAPCRASGHLAPTTLLLLGSGQGESEK